MWKQLPVHSFIPLAPYRYDAARVSLDKLTSPPATPELDEIVREDQLAYYLYQMSFKDSLGNTKLVKGVYGMLELSADELAQSSLDLQANSTPIRDHILVHEHTIASGAHLSSEDATSVIGKPGTGPIWGILIRNSLDLESVKAGPILSRVKDNSSVNHELFRIAEINDISTIRNLVESSQLIIADGHHRIARAIRRLSTAKSGTKVRLLCFVTNLEALEAEIRPIHRCFKTQLTIDQILERLAKSFIVELQDGSPTESQNAEDSLLLLSGELSFSVKPRRRLPLTNDALESQTISKILEAKSTQYLTDVKKVRERTRSDSSKIGLINRPITINQIRRAALSRTPLPAKSTMFFPKPLAGLILGDRIDV